MNFILGKSVAEYNLPDNEKTQNVFIKEALLLKQALSLCSSLVDEQTRMEAAFFESVRTMTVRLVSKLFAKLDMIHVTLTSSVFMR